MRIVGASIVPRNGGWFVERYLVAEPGRVGGREGAVHFS